MERILILSAAFVLDLLFGDPPQLWHPVQGIGKVITYAECALRKVLRIAPEREADRRKKQWAGILLAIWVLLVSVGVAALILFLAGHLHPLVKEVLECILCYRMLAVKSLRKESMKVYAALQNNDIEQAREAVSRIVGRDTARLDQEGIIKAAVETVAENTSDGVVAPLLYMLLFGALGGVFYKAVNTMDSMVGYKNDTYLYFGRAAARLDDVLNFIPSRIAAVFMIASAFLLRYDSRNAAHIYRRDRRRHASPNSAQTEAVCAGALGIELAGDAWYFGTLFHKPAIGDPMRKVEAEDIRRVNRLLYMTSILTLLSGVAAVVLLRLLAA